MNRKITKLSLFRMYPILWKLLELVIGEELIIGKMRFVIALIIAFVIALIIALMIAFVIALILIE